MLIIPRLFYYLLRALPEPLWVSCVARVAKKNGSWPPHCIKLGICIPKARAVVIVSLDLCGVRLVHQV